MVGLLIILAVSTTALADQQYIRGSRDKPGTCPIYDVIRNCRCRPGPQGCSSDYDCPYDLKCCTNSCGCRRECRAPELEGRNLPWCYYYGRFYWQGQTFPSIDGCNTCICQGNNNVGCTYIDCSALCNEPQVTGPCLAYFVRWWYNSATNQCEQFIYGGCQGNGNNFETEQACLRRCGRRGLSFH